MQWNSSRQRDAIKRFWDNYLEYVLNHGVNPRVARWYTIWVAQYLKAFSNQRLAAHKPEDVVGYLEKLGRLDRIEAWQFRQIVDAIQNLFAMLDVPWLADVDWQHDLDSSVSLNDIVSFPQYLAVRRNVLASIQNQALNALIFFYNQVVKKSISGTHQDIALVRRRRKVSHSTTHQYPIRVV
jgi:hypothetical protein